MAQWQLRRQGGDAAVTRETSVMLPGTVVLPATPRGSSGFSGRVFLFPERKDLEILDEHGNFIEFVRFPAGSAPLGQQQMFPVSSPGTCPCSHCCARPTRADGEHCAVHAQVTAQHTHGEGSAATGCMCPALPAPCPGCRRTQTFTASLQTGQRSFRPQRGIVTVPAVGWFSPSLPSSSEC